MKTIPEILKEFWFPVPGVGKTRLDERDGKRLIEALEAGGWVLVPRAVTTEMMAAAMTERNVSGSGMLGMPRVYTAMVEARPR